MNRLTYKNPNGTWGMNNGYDMSKVPSELYGALYKLKDYEETGLSPEQVEQIDRLYLERCEEINNLKKELKEKTDELERRLLEGGNEDREKIVEGIKEFMKVAVKGTIKMNTPVYVLYMEELEYLIKLIEQLART